jgi:uncharacterized protein YbjT (DUF2867 family)
MIETKKILITGGTGSFGRKFVEASRQTALRTPGLNARHQGLVVALPRGFTF